MSKDAKSGVGGKWAVERRERVCKIDSLAVRR